MSNITFEEDRDAQICICRSDKLVTAIHISRVMNGYGLFVVSMEKGSAPAELSGQYTSLDKAKAAVAKYVSNKKESVAARRENFAKEREERKALKHAAKSLPESS